MNKPYDYYRQLTDSNIECAKKDAKKMQSYIENSKAVYHGIIVRSLYIPKLFTTDMEHVFSNLCTIMYGILEKVIHEYETNAKYRKLFNFDPRLEELILRSDRYNSKLPIARIDIFFNEDDYSFKFCEFNADGASAMNEDRELNIAVKNTCTYREFSKSYDIKTYELFDSWVDEFLNIYSTSENAKSKPNIAIADFFPHDIGYEFKRFCKHFKNRGLNCEVCEIRDLRYDGEHLISPSGMIIDAIYRRAVTCDIMEHYNEVQPFINAVRDNKTVLIGDFKTQVIHNKLIFKILRDNMTRDILTDEENAFIEEHIPFTTVLTREEIDKYDVLNNKDKWIIKPQDSYASKGFHAGVEYKSDAEWAKTITDIVNSADYDNTYLLQEYIKPYETENIDLLHDENAPYMFYSSITGLFVYNGSFAGVYSRIAKTSIISTQYSEMSLASMIAKEK